MEIYRGQIIHTPTSDKFEIIENGYIIVDEGKVVSIIKELPEEYHFHPINSYGNRIIIPGFNDTHIHAPQYPNRGLCLDESLIKWLFDCTFPLEGKMKNLEFAKKVYKSVIHDMWLYGNTRSLIYNTSYYEPTKILFDLLVQSGLGGFVGKVNMDINVPDYLLEDTDESLDETERFILETQNVSRIVKPIIAPRFAPSSTRKLLAGLGFLALKYQTPITSHLSEDLDEIMLVNLMFPEFETYADIFNYYGLFGQTPTVMAHCIYSNEKERNLIKKNGVWVSHLPSSNFNLGSGLMPVRKFLDLGIKVGLGCDVSGAGSMSILNVMKDAIATSKIIWLYSNKTLKPITSSEAFYMATKGGGSFFGKVGSFEEGYDFDALVIDDSDLLDLDYTLEQRIKRFIYIGSHNNIVERYVAGRHIPRPNFIDD